MSHYSTLFSSLLLQLPRHSFEALVKQYGAGRYAKKLSTWNQFTALLYALEFTLTMSASICTARCTASSGPNI